MTNFYLLPLTFLSKLLQPDAHFISSRMKLKQVKWRWSSIFHRETPAILEKDVTARMKSNKTSTRTAAEDINRTPRLPPSHNPTYKHHTPAKENRQHDTPPNPPTDITTLHPLKRSSSKTPVDQRQTTPKSKRASEGAQLVADLLEGGDKIGFPAI